MITYNSNYPKENYRYNYHRHYSHHKGSNTTGTKDTAGEKLTVQKTENDV